MADKFNIIDKPNERSSHNKITLRGGGVVFYFGALLSFMLSGFQYPFFMLGITLIAAVSFADDVRPLSSKLRLPIHFAAMALMFYEWGLFAQPYYYLVLALVLSVGIINAYNFMDGINGITGAYSVSVLLALLFVNLKVHSFVDNELIYLMLLAVMVFNIFNFRKKARCFAGDVGSVTIAFFIVFLLGKLIIATGDFTYILFLGVYGVDSVLTIMHRIMLKENIFEAHRKHAYQLMANELKIPHLNVSLFYGILQLVLSLAVVYDYCIAIALTVLFGIVYILFKRKYFHLHKY
jgi:UDP-N-acetylmuramyl pentapeptide phosphotransferase/UDP-N-acetylglucosamine-1-phosphate transferase